MIKNFLLSFLFLSTLALGYLSWESRLKIESLKSQIKTQIKPEQCVNFLPEDIQPAITCPKGLKFHRIPIKEGNETAIREYCSNDVAEGIQKHIGPFVVRRLSGSIGYSGSYNSDGIREGTEIEYDANGKKVVERQVRNGMSNGWTYHYRLDGTLEKKDFYINDQISSGTKNPILVFRKKEFYACRANTTCFNFSLANKSENAISRWEIEAIIRDTKGNQIGVAAANGATLESMREINSTFSFPKVQPKQVAYYTVTAKLIELTIEKTPFDATKEFKIQQ